ncbi:MAG TPA: Maf family protein [Thermoanaerobaculia bacterium]|nr:Maf family protein [Thermoanaerobaculia bacterium]
MRLLLASTSPRRVEILGALGIPFDQTAADVDETVLPGESGRDAAVRLARAKAAAAAALHRGRWVLAADTLVLIDGIVLGKPRDDADAAGMLARISGREHVVVTAVSLLRHLGPDLATVEESRVRIAPLDEEEILWYVATGEPRDKAGAYAVQGLGARFVESVDGSFSNVMGLPARSVYRLLRRAPDPALARLALASEGASSRTSVRPPPRGSG